MRTVSKTPLGRRTITINVEFEQAQEQPGIVVLVRHDERMYSSFLAGPDDSVESVEQRIGQCVMSVACTHLDAEQS